MTDRKQITTEDARIALLDDQQQRVNAALQELQVLLRKYRVRLDWVETRRNGQLLDAGFKLVAMD